MSLKCPFPHIGCENCDCMGITCQHLFPGLKVEWPELRGVSGLEAKRIIENDNPKVTCVLVPQGDGVLHINCCNRVLLRLPANDCPNGPVLNLPQVG
ncbi:PREDICTED: inhibitor of trypsin and hageman factor-like [Camelina sativa]|uniref:Inhibitor of trypsin and hageman factor-like n=1 Tax=Camelina sativa TaxID=90675 RepID=A0ABM0THK4_CAMSA|nr:PREDICTED: inhibitor of trypsin and hageman factor-like [Camelina sativa]